MFSIPAPASPNANSAMLLVFHAPVPTEESERQQLQLDEQLQRQPEFSARVLHIDANQHPAVVLSFSITHFPTLILVQRGVELFRYEGTIRA